MKKIFLVLVLAIIFISACTQITQNQSEQNQKMQLKLIEFEFSDVTFAGTIFSEKIQIQLEGNDFILKATCTNIPNALNKKICKKEMLSFKVEENKVITALNKIKNAKAEGETAKCCDRAFATAKIVLEENNKTIEENFIFGTGKTEFTEAKQLLNELNDLFGLNLFEEETTWLSIEPIQCKGNAWEKWLAESDIRFAKEPTEKEVLTVYFKNALNIELLDYKSQKKYDVVCMACNCPRGDEIFVKIYSKDKEKLIALGWKEVIS